MRESPSTQMRLLGSLAGLLVGAALGALVGMGFNSILSGSLIGASIGLVIGFCFPRSAGHMFDAFTNPF